MTISASAEVSEAGTSRYTKWAIALFFVALFIPGSANLGIRMTPYRLYLMVMAIPMVLRAAKDPSLRITAVDVLIFLFLFWQSLSILVIHQTSEMVLAGASFGENLLGYMLGRIFIRSASDFRFFFKCFLAMLLATLPFALVESVTHRRLLGDLASHVLRQPDEPSAAEIRFGLLRARGSFETFLIFGAFCAVGFANVFYVYSGKFPKNVLYPSFVAFMTALAISTSSLLTVFIQTSMILYGAIFKWFRHKWIALAIASVVPLIFAKAIINFIKAEVMFSYYSGDSRSLHFHFGFNEILRHPIFGIGQNPWANAYWLSQAVDNFWLSLALRRGIPSVILAICFFGVHAAKIARAQGLPKDEALLRTGYLISFVSIMIGFFTFNFFAASLVFFMMYCGAGAMFYNGSRPKVGGVPQRLPAARPQTTRQRSARPAGGQFYRPR